MDKRFVYLAEASMPSKVTQYTTSRSPATAAVQWHQASLTCVPGRCRTRVNAETAKVNTETAQTANTCKEKIKQRSFSNNMGENSSSSRCKIPPRRRVNPPSDAPV